MIRFGTIGTGWITEDFIKAVEKANSMSSDCKMQLSAIYSRNLDRAKQFAKPYGNVKTYTDIEKLAKNRDIDAVYIASPNALHYEQSKLFLQNSKHVICEKPVTVTAEQFSRLSKLARQNNVIYIDSIMSYNTVWRLSIHQALKQIGKVTSAHLDFSQLSSKYQSYKDGKLPNIFNPKLATGGLMDLGVYCVYGAVDLFGMPKQISSSSGFLQSGADAYGTAILDYDNMQVTITYSKIGQSHCPSQILGDSGTMTIKSISMYSGVDIIKNQQTTQIIKEVDRTSAMCGIPLAFMNYVAQPDNLDYNKATKITHNVCTIMDTIREKSGIVFK